MKFETAREDAGTDECLGTSPVLDYSEVFSQEEGSLFTKENMTVRQNAYIQAQNMYIIK